MNNILYIDCCARRDSRTRALAERLLSRLDGETTRLYLYGEDMTPVGENAIALREKADEKTLRYAKQLKEADEIVIAAPFWDLSFPSVLKVWFENASVVGVTFEYGDNGAPVGLCRAKRAFYVTTAGGAIFDTAFGEGYAKALLKLFGVNEFHSFKAEGLDIYGADVDGILDGARREIDRFFGKKRVSVAAALIRDGDKFMICQRPANKARGLLWEFAGGKREEGETLEQTLVRECKEELDVTVKPLSVFTSLTHEYPDLTVELTLFNAVITDGVPKKLEHNDLRWITKDDIDGFEFCPADKEILEMIKNDGR